MNGFAENEEDGVPDDAPTMPGTAIQEMLQRLGEEESADWGDITQEMETNVPPLFLFGSTILPPPPPTTPESPYDLTVEDEESGPRTERNPITGLPSTDWPEA